MMSCLRHNSPPQRGSTLLELILYIGIISIVMISVVAFSVEFLATRLKADATAEAAWNARFAVGRLAAEIRQANNFAVASTFGVNPSTLILCSATPCLPGNETIFTVTGGVLTVSVNGGAALPLTSPKVTVADFTVTNLSTDSSLPSSARSRNFAVRVRAVFNETGLWPVAPEATYQTTERIRRSEGFAN
jgi:type II secretory pathway pseudopilin PulG